MNNLQISDAYVPVLEKVKARIGLIRRDARRSFSVGGFRRAESPASSSRVCKGAEKMDPRS